MGKGPRLKETENGIIPEDWEIRKVGDFVEIKHGYAFKGEFFSEIPNENVVLTPGNFDIGGGFKRQKFKYTTEEIPAGYVLKEGDIIVTMTDLSKEGDTLGYAAMVPHDTTKKFLHNQRLGLLVFKSEEISKDFLYWALRTRRYNQFVVGSASGSTVKHTSPDRIREYPFVLPTNQLEQSRIAEMLSNLDSKIELDQQMNKTLEAICKAIFKHWFIDFEFPNDDGKPYKSSGGEMTGSEELLNEIPKGWEKGEIKDCGRIVCGKTPPTKDKENYGDDFLFITIPDMHNQIFVINTERRLSQTGAETQKQKELPPLSICVSCIATPGIVVLTSEKSHTNQQINSIVCNEGINPYFMYLAMKGKSNEIRSKGLGGTATLNLNTGDFGNIRIVLPKKDIIKRFGIIVNPIFRKILEITRETQTLSQIRDSLLPKLMSGKIRVPVEGR